MKLKKNNVINPQNYVYSIIILVGGILLTLYVFKYYQVKKEERLMTSYLVNTKTINYSVNSLESLQQIMQESPSSYFIYLSYTGDEEIYNLERKLKRIIDKYKINDIFYYVDLTYMVNNDSNYIEKIKEILNISKLNNLPAIIYINEGEILNDNILDGVNNTMLKPEDLEKLLNIYDFEIVK